MDNKEKDHSNHKLPCLQNFRLLSIIAVSLWGIAWFFLWCVFSSSVTDCANIVKSNTSWISAGTFGDMFGCLTCLFTGISVAGVIVTLQQQKQSLHVQQNELDILKSQSKKQNQLNEKAYILKLIEGYISYREKTTITVQTLDIQGKYFREELRHTSFAERFCNIQSRLLNLLGQYVENKISKNEVEECYAAHQLLLEGTIQHRLQLLFLLTEIKNSSLSDKDKENLFCQLGIFVGACDIMLLHIEVVSRFGEQDIGSANKDWGINKLRNVMYNSLPDITNQSTKLAASIMYVESMKAQKLCVWADAANHSLPESFNLAEWVMEYTKRNQQKGQSS